MHETKGLIILLILFTYNTHFSNAGVWEWLIYGSDYENPDKPKQVEDHSEGSSLGNLVKVPFEMRTADEKFLVEASKFGLQASDLDLCHHKVIMHLKKSCGALTEEDIGKLSVQLLNCQSSVEGRKTYKCTYEMSIGQCTKDMDANTWNAYHIVSNRARAVCYAARQQQFTAKTEMTVNKLVWTSENQIVALEKLEAGQNKVTNMTEKTLDTMIMGQKELAERQERLKASQQHIQTFVNGNLRELTREKALIAAGQKELASMTEAIQKKLDLASKQLQLNENDRKLNHQEILRDFALVQTKTKEMWIKIDNSTQNILSQHMETISHYQETLQNLQKINNTVTYLLDLIDKTRADVDSKLGWLGGILGDAGDRLTIIYCCLVHGTYFMSAAVTASFLNLPIFCRIAILVMVPLNALSELKQQSCLDFISLTMFLLSTILFNWMINSAKKAIHSPPGFLHTCYRIQNSIKQYKTRTTQKLEYASDKFKQKCVDRRSSMGFLNNISSNGFIEQNFKMDSPANSLNTPTNNLNTISEDDVLDVSNVDNIIPGTSTPNKTDQPKFENSNVKKNLLKDLDRNSFGLETGLTPPRRRTSISSSTGRRICSGVNKSGTPCKSSASVGHDFCHHHLH